MTDKHKIRRRWARLCLVFMMSVGIALVASWFFGNEKTAGIIQASTGILALLLPCFTGIVLMYYKVTGDYDQNEVNNSKTP